mgnify:CR=1 FL=1
MTIYFAAPWKHRDAARLARDQFEAAGIHVNSRWLDFNISTTDENNPEVLRQEAENDITDLIQVDAFVVWNLDISEGKACETGIALMLGIPIISVGQGRNVFLHLTQVNRVDTIDDAIAALHNLPNHRF